MADAADFPPTISKVCETCRPPPRHPPPPLEHFPANKKQMVCDLFGCFAVSNKKFFREKQGSLSWETRKFVVRNKEVCRGEQGSLSWETRRFSVGNKEVCREK